MMNIFYQIGSTIGLPAFGIVVGLATIHLIECWRGNYRGPIYTATTKRGPGIVFAILLLVSATGVYAYIRDILATVK